MSYSIGCHQDFKTVEAWQEIILYVTLPYSLHVLEFPVDLVHRFGQKSACSRCGVEYLHTVETLLVGGFFTFSTFCVLFVFDFAFHGGVVSQSQR